MTGTHTRSHNRALKGRTDGPNTLPYFIYPYSCLRSPFLFISFFFDFFVIAIHACHLRVHITSHVQYHVSCHGNIIMLYYSIRYVVTHTHAVEYPHHPILLIHQSLLNTTRNTPQWSMYVHTVRAQGALHFSVKGISHSASPCTLSMSLSLFLSRLIGRQTDRQTRQVRLQAVCPMTLSSHAPHPTHTAATLHILSHDTKPHYTIPYTTYRIAHNCGKQC